MDQKTIELGDETVSDILQHYGVKGMKWGVRKDGTPHTRRSAKKEAKAEKKWERDAMSPRKFIAVYNSTADKMNSRHVDRINNKPEYKNADFTNDSPLRRKYYKEYSDTFMREMGASAKEILGESPTGKTLQFKEGPNGSLDAYIVEKSATHADDDVRIVIERDEKKRFVSFKIVTPLIQGETVDDVIAHYGVKGMKWGVRRSREERIAARSAPSTVKVKAKPARRGSQAIKVVNKSGGRVRTAGGRRNLATEDAVRAAVNRQLAKSSGTNSLSNKQLKQTIERMNLEQQFKKLTKQADKPSLSKFVDALLGVAGDQPVANVASGGTGYARQVRPKAITSG